MFISLEKKSQTARRKEKEAAAAQREENSLLSKVTLDGPTSINVDEKYKHMLVLTTTKKVGVGSADDAWDD